MRELGWNIKDDSVKMAKATELFKTIEPIIEKLKSEENKKFFENKILPDEMEYLKDEFSL
jgi:CRISPR/Cas system endoribonuclease Cas6 (RAMP superfamily)